MGFCGGLQKLVFVGDEGLLGHALFDDAFGLLLT